MTTKITVDAHAGWPVEVYAIDSYAHATPTVAETLLGVVQPGEVRDFYATGSREIRAVTSERRFAPSRVALCQVSGLRNLCTERPAEYRAAAFVGRTWFGPPT